MDRKKRPTAVFKNMSCVRLCHERKEIEQFNCLLVKFDQEMIYITMSNI